MHIQGHTWVTQELLVHKIQAIARGYAWLRHVCDALHHLADAPPAAPSPKALPPDTASLPSQLHLTNSKEGLRPILPTTQAPTPQAVSDQRPCILDHVLPVGIQEAADNTGNLPVNPEGTPAHAQLSGEDTALSAATSNTMPFVPAGTLRNDTNFPRAFSNPLYNQHTPGGVPRLM